MNVIEFFDRVRIINMVTRQDRRDETVAEFERHNFEINTDKVNFFKAITPTEAEEFPNAATRGCFLSHMTILEDAAKDQLKNVLILEDDIQFTKSLKTHGDEAVEALGKLDWDIAYFGHGLADAPGEAEWKKVSEPMWMAHLYAMNGKTLERFLAFLNEMLSRPAWHEQGGPMHYDGALNTFMDQNPDINAYYFSKNFGFQRPSKTNIHKHAIYDTNPLLKPLMSIYRKIKKKYLQAVR